MPEFFDITLIANEYPHQKSNLQNCLFNKMGIREGNNNFGQGYEFFKSKYVVVTYMDKPNVDFTEVVIGISDLVFHREKFNLELKSLTDFIEQCFKECSKLTYALCSFTLNAYLLRNIKELKQFDEDLLCRFPIVYYRNDETLKMIVNLDAQDIF